jgi:hypothetical protein
MSGNQAKSFAPIVTFKMAPITKVTVRDGQTGIKATGLSRAGAAAKLRAMIPPRIGQL